ncbi:MAG TPA: hypothetical protein VMZ53_21525 [Kofleriaceae bacterium]|nr:hypothetical protein [Kofleriaceae bacterium]
MRCRLVVVAVLLDLTAPAVACPPLDTCLVQLPSTTRLPHVSPAHVRVPASQDAAVSEVGQPPNLTEIIRELTPPPRPAPGEVEMPWIWMALRAQVYSRMPTYEQSHDFKIVLSPVVVSSPSDTVPGVGIAGDF